MKQGKNYYADKRRELNIYVDVRLPKEPVHCHLRYKGEAVGCFLLEDESKNRTFKNIYDVGFLSRFKKTALRKQFDFVPEATNDKVERFLERYREDAYRNAHLGAEIKEEDTQMLEVCKKFVMENADALIEDQNNL